MSENFQIELLTQHLGDFEFRRLFNELGWSNPASDKSVEFIVAGETFTRRQISQLSGAVVFEITSANGSIPDKNLRQKVQLEITKLHQENVLIFVDENRSGSLWYWTKFENKKRLPREHLFIKGQPVDLMLGKITALNFEIGELDNDGNVPIIAVARKLQKALDIERVTKKFFGEFEKLHIEFLKFVEGIGNERDKKWYASVILNRLMFIYFLQKKFFIDNDQNYLQNQLKKSKAKGHDFYYRNFLNQLFFAGFAKHENDRKADEKLLLGDVPYLNGGLFLRHKIEIEYGEKIHIADQAFENLFDLFESYSWHLDDTPSGKPDEINPDVLGYIFEKYINQKAFGAYYTRPEITGYLCEQTIYKLILDKVNSLAKPADGLTPNMFSTNDGGLFLNRTFGSISDLLLNLDDFLCEKLWHDILPSLKLLDPACGSGAFLVAALKTLLNVYSAVIGRIEISGGKLNDELNEIRKDHAFNYFLKKQIITDNLFGVDIMEEATEIAKLRLFMTLVSSVKERNQLEPLPNIDFNILVGNSLIGILNVKGDDFNKLEKSPQGFLFADEVSQSYQKILEGKEQSIKLYKEHSFNDDETSEILDKSTRLLQLREHIEKIRRDSYEKLNELLLGDFNDLKIKFEAASWDAAKNKLGKPTKRDLTKQDIEDLQPFHWGFEFPAVFKQGGFDAIITNPPWEIFKPIAKEFCYDLDSRVTRRGTNIKDFEKLLSELLEDESIREKYIHYVSGFPHVNLYFRNSQQYKNQISIINGERAKIDINLYKLFLEQCFNLLRQDGECGIVIPSGVYSDLGAKQLREMLFNQTEITGLFCFENRKTIFESVDSRFKFVVLSFRIGGETKSFPTAFMRHDVTELLDFPNKGALKISVELVKKLSPDSLSIMEFKNEAEILIAEKMLHFPALGTHISDNWNLVFGREFHMTDDSSSFITKQNDSCLPLYEGKMIWHFSTGLSEIRYWVDKETAGKKLLSPRIKTIKRHFVQNNTKDNFNESDVTPDYNFYRMAFRAITGATNERALVVSVIPKNVVTGNSLNVSDVIFDSFSNQKWTQEFHYTNAQLLFANSLMSSFVCDWFIRNKILTNMNMFYLYQLPVPRLTAKDAEFSPIVERAAKLICTTPEFDELAKEVGLGSHENGVTNETERLKLRAELDALVAHLYGLTEAEFTYILTTFPIVSQVVKDKTLEAFRIFAPHPDDSQLVNLIKHGENNYLEFKVAACWNAKTGKKDDTMKLNITEGVTAFLNSNDGGALLIGVENNGTIAGLAADYQNANQQKQDRDGYERFLVDLIRHNCNLTHVSTYCEISFHNLHGNDVCRIAVKPSSEPIYHNRQKDFIVRDGGGKKKLNPQETVEYIRKRWK